MIYQHFINNQIRQNSKKMSLNTRTKSQTTLPKFTYLKKDTSKQTLIHEPSRKNQFNHKQQKHHKKLLSTQKNNQYESNNHPLSKPLVYKTQAQQQLSQNTQSNYHLRTPSSSSKGHVKGVQFVNTEMQNKQNNAYFTNSASFSKVQISKANTPNTFQKVRQKIMINEPINSIEKSAKKIVSSMRKPPMHTARISSSKKPQLTKIHSNTSIKKQSIKQSFVPKVDTNKKTNTLINQLQYSNIGVSHTLKASDFIIFPHKYQISNGYCQSFPALHRQTGFICFIKVLDICFLQDQGYLNIALESLIIQQKCQHPNISKIYGIFQQHRKVYIIHQFIYTNSKLQLQTLENKKGLLNESQTINILSQSIDMINYLHSLGIVHCNLTLQSMVLDFSGVLKVMDFSWTCLINSQQRKNRFCGNLLYTPPEFLQGLGYNQSIDIWGLGTFIYLLLTGMKTFQINNSLSNSKACLKSIEKAQIRLPLFCSDNAIDCLSKMLSLQSDRASLEQIRTHKWLQKFQNREQNMVDRYIWQFWVNQ